MDYGERRQSAGRAIWRDSGVLLNNNRVWKFDRNYRNPATVVAFANDILKSGYWRKDQDLVLPEESLAEGPKPVLKRFSGAEQEQAWLIRTAAEVSQAATSVIVCRHRTEMDELRKALERHGAENEREAYADELKLLYVSVTRARYGLYMSYYGTLSPLFPAGSKNYAGGGEA